MVDRLKILHEIEQRKHLQLIYMGAGRGSRVRDGGGNLTNA
jgi:hypothetical protein